MITVKVPRRVAATAVPEGFQGKWTVWDLYHNRPWAEASGLNYDDARLLAHYLSKLLIAMYYD